MILLADTRQKAGKHDTKEKYFAEHGIEIRHSKLYVADYTLPTNQSICIDTKQNIEELIADICGKEHERFRNELIRAQESGIKLYILVENKDRVKDLNDLFKWQNPRTHRYNKIAYMHNIGKWQSIKLPKSKPTPGSTIAKACYTMSKKYGAEFLFCKPSESGAKILELLGVNVNG